MDPIFFRGTPFSACKSHFEGMHRIQSPEEAWKKIAPLAPLIGVTRIANITNLDRIGIPVTVAIRPGSLTLSTSSGKGLTLAAAQVSALMESLELYTVEEAILPFILAPYNELIKKHKVPPLSQLSYRTHSLFHPDLPEKWVLGWDLFKQEEIAVPLLNVAPDYPLENNLGLPSFNIDSNGLASGCHFLEALAAGIYEMIERDAVTCHLFRERKCSHPLNRVDLSTICYPRVLEILEKIEKAGIKPILYDCSVDTEVPVFKSIVYDKLIRNSTGICEGYGAHLDPEVAIIRALTEAVQSRAIVIAGSRDDNFLGYYNSLKNRDVSDMLKMFDKETPSIDASSYSSSAGRTLQEDIHILMRKLQRAHLSELIVFDLSKKELGVSVVRVIIPGLEGYYRRNYVPGTRAKKFASVNTNEPSYDKKYGMHSPAGALL